MFPFGVEHLHTCKIKTGSWSCLSCLRSSHSLSVCQTGPVKPVSGPRPEGYSVSKSRMSAIWPFTVPK